MLPFINLKGTKINREKITEYVSQFENKVECHMRFKFLFKFEI